MEASSPSRLYVTAKAPVNIAVIKYWGKRDEKLILPINSSLSTTLNMEDLCTITSVMASKSFPTDRLWLNGEEQDLNTQARMKRCIEELKRRATSVLSADGKEVIVDKESLQKDYHLHIVSRNNFPTAAGLASSAAGFACLAYSVAQVLGVKGELSELARLGSGSACRSVYGGFVKWNKGEQADGSDSIAEPVAEASHWPELQILICVVSDKKKGVSSTSGMETSTKTSELLKYRAEHIVEPRIKEMEDAIKARDFAKFGELTMKDSNQFHATCLDTYPPIFYMNDISKTIVHVISAFNKEAGTIKAAYTFDAGPNAVVYALKEDFPKLLKTLLYYFPPAENSTEEDFYGHFFEKKQVLADAGITSLEDVKNVTIDESLRGALRLDRQYGVLQKMIHTTVGPGPFVAPEEEGLINKETGLPL